MNSYTIKKTIYIDSKPERVFDALTTSDSIIKYYPLKKVSSEWKTGGEILLDGELNGVSFRDYGVIDILSRPGQFKYSYWSENHGTERIPENYQSIDYRLSVNQKGTQLTLVHSNLKTEAMFEIMNSAWDELLKSLASYVENLN